MEEGGTGSGEIVMDGEREVVRRRCWYSGLQLRGNFIREGGAVVCDQSGDDDGLRLVGHGDADGERSALSGEEGDVKGIGHEVGSGPTRRL